MHWIFFKSQCSSDVQEEYFKDCLDAQKRPETGSRKADRGGGLLTCPAMPFSLPWSSDKIRYLSGVTRSNFLRLIKLV